MGQRKFVIFVVEYFTKWIEVVAMACITQRQVEKFIWENVVYSYGVPNTLIIDNGTQLTGEHMKDFCEGLHNCMAQSFVAHP